MKDCIDHGQMVGKFTYGKKTVRRKSVGYHVWAYCTHHGLDPFSLKGTGKVIRHSCDNKRCINPEHMTLGTVSDNIQDAIERDLTKYKLDYDSATEIRRLHKEGRSISSLSRQFNVSWSAIDRVVKGSTWNDSSTSA